jgi:hypothetical protein
MAFTLEGSNMSPQTRHGVTALLIATSLLVLSCGGGDSTDVNAGPQSDREASGTREVGADGASRAYSYETLDEFASVADQIAIVTVSSIDRDPEVQQIHNDERLQLRLVRASIGQAIKNATEGEEIIFSDGVYSRTRSTPEEDYGPEQLLMATDAVELQVGDQAIVGVKDGNLLAAAVFPVVDERTTSSERSGPLYESIEGKPLGEVVAILRDATANSTTTSEPASGGG